MKRLSKVSIEWSKELAYVIGLLATDGNLSIDGRHINFTTKDYQLVKTVKVLLNLTNKIGRKSRKAGGEKKYYVLQFGDVNFYNFLLKIGLTPNKSKTLQRVDVPKKYFLDFFRGCMDGDGNINTFKHPESKNLQLRIRIFSASKDFLLFLQSEFDKYKIYGRIRTHAGIYVLVYAMGSSKKILNKIYYSGFNGCLQRKYNQAKPYLPRWRNW